MTVYQLFETELIVVLSPLYTSVYGSKGDTMPVKLDQELFQHMLPQQANAYQLMSDAELNAALEAIGKEAQEVSEKHLALDMARGKPSPEQTALSRPLLDLLTSASDLTDGASFADNYGDPDGLPSARALAAELLGVDPAQVIVAGSSSLNLMHDVLDMAYTHGIAGQKPWAQQASELAAAHPGEKLKFLCPVPGYDRHFRITEYYGFENVPVPMTEHGPDMKYVRMLVEGDSTVKGVWCVPRFANPSGVSYSDEVVRAFASLRPAAPDFRVMWDNAYAYHTFARPSETCEPLMNIFDALAQAGRDDLIIEFASTAKVTFPSSGMAWMCASEKDIQEIRASFSVRRVSPEKLLQLAHVRFLKDRAGLEAHMERHAELLRPRFELVERKLTDGLGKLAVAAWSHPKGGYFVSFNGPVGSARAIVSRTREMGVKLTSAGATWPSGNDPFDSNIRIAPSYPSLKELSQALDVFVIAVKQVAARLAKVDRGQYAFGDR